MTPLQNSLRCLKHPVTSASVILLVINDHVLKIVAPSFLTGKLSDCAGLFFFPFLLAAIFAPLRVSIQRSGALAFAITASWFTLIKTSDVGIALTQAMLRPLLGYPVAITRDPTDLFALVVLIPAWRLWNRANDPARAEHRDARAWMMLAFASLAALATSPTPPTPVFNRVVVEGKSIYMGADYTRMIAASYDGGKTWNEVYEQQRVSSEPPRLQSVVCERGNAQNCYRTGTDRVEESRDGGASWQTAWSVPLGRREFMERVARRRGFFGVSKPINLGPYDLALMEPVGANSLSTLVVAMGNEGVLVRTPENEWTRYPVFSATPTPFSIFESPDAFQVIFPELDFAVVAGLVAFLIATFKNARRILARSQYSTWRTLLPLALLIIATAIAVVLWHASGFGLLGSVLLLPLLLTSVLGWPVLAIPIVLVLFIWSGAFVWDRMSKVASGQIASNARSLCIGLAIQIAVSAFAPFLLWALGVIPIYEIALLIATILPAILLMRGLNRLNHNPAFF